MGKLVCTEDFLNKLIKESIIEPQGDGEFILHSKANLKGQSYPITITCDNNVSVEEIEEVVDNKSKTIDQWYDEIRLEFPTNVGKHLGIDGRNLRSGNKTKIKKRIRDLVDESYSMNAVVNAVKYEVWFRVKSSKPTDNKLEFMQALEAWLNNTSNIDAMIERSQESNEFKIAMNIHNNDASGTKRKIKLS